MNIIQDSNCEKSYSKTIEDQVNSINLSSLYLFRWLSVCAMCLIVALTPLLNDYDTPVLPLLTVALTLLLFNIYISIPYRHWKKKDNPPVMHELLFDIVAWGAFLFFLGGINNPLILILLPFVIIGATILPKRQAWGLGFFSLLMYTILWEFHLRITTSDTHIASYLHKFDLGYTLFISVFVSVWFISHITETVRKYIIDLADAKKAVLRDEWVAHIGGLAAGTAHELSTPISTLGTLVDSMHKQSDPVYVSRTDLELMKNQLSLCHHALTQLKQKVCYCSHAEQNENLDAFDWLNGLGHTYESLHPGTTITTELCSNISGLRFKPDISLKLAIQNLLNNAIAAEPKGILLAAHCHDGFLQIRVLDQGSGIRQDTLQRLKQRLPQQSELGLGLGLVLAKSTIERYRGSLEFTTIPQGGTEVTVELPLNEVCMP